MLRSSAVLLTGGATGALATKTVVSNTTAAEADLTVAGDDVTVRNGELAAVWLDLTVAWGYAVPSGERPATVEVDVLVGTESGELEIVDTATSEEVFLEADGEMAFSVDLLDAGVLDADALVPTEGGESIETTVHLGTEMRLLDENGMVIAADSATDSAPITIAKSEYDPSEHGSVAGTGEITIEVA